MWQPEHAVDSEVRWDFPRAVQQVDILVTGHRPIREEGSVLQPDGTAPSMTPCLVTPLPNPPTCTMPSSRPERSAPGS